MAYTNLIGAGWAVNGAPLLPGGGSIPLGANYLFVGNAAGFSGSDGNDGTMDAPLASLNAAIVKAAANKGYVIVILPGHAETISSNTALAFNKAGIQIVGQGTGASRPTFTLDTSTSTRIAVTADNIKISNCIFIGNLLSIVTCFLVGAAADFVIDSCAFRDTSSIKGFLTIVTTTVSTNSDGLTFTNNEVICDAATTPGPAVVVANTMSRLNISGNTVFHSAASNNVSALLEHGALVVSNATIAYNKVYSVNTDTATGAILVKTTATTGSGLIYNNYVKCLDTAAAILVTAAAVQYGPFENYLAGETTSLSGVILPAAGNDGA